MKCPSCSDAEDKVVDSRFNAEGNTIRRRRECQECEFRFTTYERIEPVLITVLKSDGSRRPWDDARILEGVRKACEKRPVDTDKMEGLVATVRSSIFERGDHEVSSRAIGELVMRGLREMDPIAYIRFASVYLNFSDVEEFVAVIERLNAERS